MNPTSIPEIIRDSAGMSLLCERLTGAEAVGLDTEFLRERTYYAQLCLLQLADPGGAHCVDTLALRDLDPLRPVLGAATPVKIVHAARQDLEVLWPAAGGVTGLFDTQVAAALIGLPAQIGYGELVLRLLNRTLHKAETRTDWSRRPLTPAQIEYALDDVRYLLPLRDELRTRLERLGRGSWFAQEMAELDSIGSFDADPGLAWRRFKGFQELDTDRQRLAQTLCAWRERRAMSADKPRNWILPEAALRDIIVRAPRTLRELARTAEMPEGIFKNSGAQILEVIESARLPERLPALPPRQRPDPEATAAVRKLAEIARRIGAELNLAPEILVTRRELERLVAGKRDGNVLRGWRREVIGDALLAGL